MSRRINNEVRDLIVLIWAGYAAYTIWSSVVLVWK